MVVVSVTSDGLLNTTNDQHHHWGQNGHNLHYVLYFEVLTENHDWSHTGRGSHHFVGICIS
jgi:hypothetical protein